MFLDRVIHFGETLGDEVKGRSPKKLKSLFEVSTEVQVEVHAISYNMIFVSCLEHVLTPRYQFEGKFGR